MYVVSSTFRHNRSGVVPASLDIELQAPERETTIAANLVADNGARDAPAWALPGITTGNGILIAGGLRNVVERNVIIDQSQYGVLVTPMLDKNFYPARDNILRDNTILRSGRADLALSGPKSGGNCFSGNTSTSSAPCRELSSCSAAVVCGCRSTTTCCAFVALVLVRGTLIQSATFPDWKSQPVPPPQPSMPDPRTAPVRPAMHVFDGLHFDVAEAGSPMMRRMPSRRRGARGRDCTSRS